MKIVRIVAKGLFGQYDIDWNLNPKANILSGINGSGKSTLLRAISSILKGEHLPDPIDMRINKLTVWFDDGSHIMDYVAKNIEYDQQQLNELLKKLSASNGPKDAPIKAPQVKSVSIQMMRAIKDGKDVDEDEFVKNIDSSFISTFDMAPPMPKDPGELMDKIIKSSRSELDRHLELVVEKYKTHQVELSNRMSKLLNDGDKDQFRHIKKVFTARTLMQDIMDRLLHNSGKTINRDKGDIEFNFKTDGKSHPYTDLSAGEKQLLLILLTVFLQENKEAILIMDEPEISLHVDWQTQLLDIIYELNPNCQVIVSTHSPSMILNGWHSSVVNISDIVPDHAE